MENYGIIALVVGIAMALIKVIEKLLSLVYKQLNGKKTPDEEQNIKLAVLDTRLKSIEENHLPHIEKRLDSIEKKVDKILER